MPSSSLLRGYADSAETYISSGEINTRGMMKTLADSRIEIAPDARILDFGCGIARMTRQLRSFAEAGEVWGVDISARHIFWCKRHLSPPFRFATTTTIPHLPFRDGFFSLVFAGSVFTHIDDLADAWLCEVRRVLAPGGCAYLTVHDGRRSSSCAAPTQETARQNVAGEFTLQRKQQTVRNAAPSSAISAPRSSTRVPFSLACLRRRSMSSSSYPMRTATRPAYIVRRRP